MWENTLVTNTTNFEHLCLLDISPSSNIAKSTLRITTDILIQLFILVSSKFLSYPKTSGEFDKVYL